MINAGQRGLRPLGYAQIAAGGMDASTLLSSLTFSGQPAAGIPPGTSLILMKGEAQAWRFRDDGTAPTAAIGYPVAVGVEYQYDAANMEAVRVISQVAGCILNVECYGKS